MTSPCAAEMAYPRRASRAPLEGARLADWQNRLCGRLKSDFAAFAVTR